MKVLISMCLVFNVILLCAVLQLEQERRLLTKQLSETSDNLLRLSKAVLRSQEELNRMSDAMLMDAKNMELVCKAIGAIQ